MNASMPRSRGLPYLLAVSLALTPAVSSAALQIAALINIGDTPLLGDRSFAAAVSPSDVVLGQWFASANATTERGFAARVNLDGSYTLTRYLPARGFTRVAPVAANAAGVVVGWARRPNGNDIAFYGGPPTEQGANIIPGTGTSSQATAINASGVAVGYASGLGGQGGEQAFVYKGSGNAQALPGLSGAPGRAHDVNDNNLVVGYTADPQIGQGFGSHRAFVYDLTTDTRLELPTEIQSRGSEANAVNNQGAVAGSYFHPDAQVGQGVVHGFLVQGGQLTDLSLDGFRNAQALDINNHGWVVGVARGQTGDIGATAVLWAHGQAFDLSAIEGLDALGWSSLDIATGINDNGWIVGTGTFDGRKHAFALQLVASSVPEPSTTLFVALGAVALGWLARRRVA